MWLWTMRWSQVRRSESIGELAKALAAFQGEMPPVPKASQNPFFHSSYADLADVRKLSAPILSKHGLFVSQDPETIDGADWLTSLLMHSSGEWTESSIKLTVAKNDSQGVGSALTYMRRYAYCAILGIVADADDDGNAASDATHTPVTRTSGVVKGSAVDKANKRAKPTTIATTTEASEAQWKYLMKLSDQLLEPLPTGELTAAEASELIDKLQARKKEK